MTEKTSKADKAAAAPKWSLLESALWSPAKAGDNVIGQLGESEMGPFGEQQTLRTGQTTESGSDLVVLPHLAALSDLSRLPFGTLVRITYTGEKVSKAGHTYKAFTIETGGA